MSEMCIFSSNKVCDDCGECDRCDLDTSKTCNSCGNCLKTSRNEYEKVIIDEIDEVEDDEFLEIEPEKVDEYEEEGSSEELLEDIEGLAELINIPENEVLEEVYPGFFTYRKEEKGMQ
ncbi:MAG: hypothetical protein Q8930_00220 [Bacillota bacterium]|nr:hypothetical protein [Bacillota bacterium]